ncbi:hypothetical protein ACJW31_06G103900 [Castanea mollissima]
MSSTRKAIVAVSVGVVEAMKDQGVCRWNFIMRSAQQHAKNHLRSISQTRNLSSLTSADSCMVLSRSMATTNNQGEEPHATTLERQVQTLAAAVERLTRQNQDLEEQLRQRNAHQSAPEEDQEGASSEGRNASADDLLVFSSASSSAMVSSKLRDDKMKQSEESLRKVMYLSCWGPN